MALAQDDLAQRIIKILAKDKHRAEALDLLLLLGMYGKQGYRSTPVGIMRLTLSDVEELLDCNRGNASRLLNASMKRMGVTRLNDGVLILQEVG